MDDEKKRIAVLREYKVLDTAAEKVFDDLTRLAAAICGAPISLVSLVDADRQWFKSRFGLDAEETPREYAFCAHAIQGNSVMVVEDASNDERFHDNPLVLGDPNIRFYAGAPLTVSSGYNLGTLCIIDRIPRTINRTQLESLEILRDAVVTQLELHRTVADLRALERLVPICAWCRKVKMENDDWRSLEDYVAEVSPVTHGMCPNCAKELATEG